MLGVVTQRDGRLRLFGLDDDGREVEAVVNPIEALDLAQRLRALALIAARQEAGT